MHRPEVTKNFDAVAIAAETTVWDPAPSKRVRVLEMLISCSVTGSVVFRNGTAGPTLLVVPVLANSPVYVPLGDGMICDVDANLTADGPAASTLTGYIRGLETA